MSAGYGFGSFMEGLQGGVKAGQDIRRQRQMDDIYDAARRKIKNEEAADNIGRDFLGLPAGDDTALSDPLGQRIFEWAKGMFKGGDDASTAVPDPGAAEFQDKVQRVDSLTPEDGFVNEPQQYAADGGQMQALPVQVFADGTQADDEEKKREQARAERYGATAKQAIPAAGNVAGKALAAGPKATGGVLNSIADIVDAGTDDPLNDHPILGTAGDWIEGAFDTPRVAIASGLRSIGDKASGMMSLEQKMPAKAATPGTTPEDVQQKMPARALPPGGRDRRSFEQKMGASSAVPPPGAAPAATQPVAAADVIKDIPWDKVNPMDLPKFKTQDWVAYRDTAVKQMVMRGGVTVADAMDKVDQQVIGMQQRGTKALLQEAIMRLQVGDMQGAGNALVQMFQYVPSGTDAVVGTYNGQLVAQFIDEATGQPVSKPEPVDAKMLGDLWQQYSNPAAWAQMAQDRAQLADQQARTGLMGRAQDLAEKKYREIDIPTAQSEADYRAMAGMGSMLKGAGREGLKPSEGLASDKAASESIDRYAMMADADGNPLYPKLQDPGIREQLRTAIMILTRNNPSIPADVYIQQILSAAKE